MSKEEAINLLKQVNHILVNSNSWLENTHEPLNTAFSMAIKALEEPSVNDVLDKIYVDIQKLRGCSCSCSDGIIDDVEDIIDKYKAESEE